MDANLTTPALIFKQFNAFTVTYVIHKERTNTKENTPNAFDRMMSTANKKFAPDKVQVNNNFDKLMNELISYLNESELGWSKSIVDTKGNSFVKCLTSVLWHIIYHHDSFKERFIDIPPIFRKYQNYDDYVSKRKSKPQMTN